MVGWMGCALRGWVVFGWVGRGGQHTTLVTVSWMLARSSRYWVTS